MSRLRISPAASFTALFLLLCFIGIINTDNDNHQNTISSQSSHTRFDRADEPLLLTLRTNKNNGRHQGFNKYNLRSPTGTASAPPLPTPTQTCYNPPLTVPASQVHIDELCQCPSYPQPDANPIPYYNAGSLYSGGKVYCETTCVPVYANQTRVVDEAKGSLSQCIAACDGSFEKKRTDTSSSSSSDEYWFCHGVNFVQGEFCEFIGAIAYSAWGSEGVECYDNGLTPSG